MIKLPTYFVLKLCSAKKKTRLEQEYNIPTNVRETRNKNVFVHNFV